MNGNGGAYEAGIVAQAAATVLAGYMGALGDVELPDAQDADAMIDRLADESLRLAVRMYAGALDALTGADS